MLEKAIEKLRQEMDASKEPYIIFVGQYMIDHIKGRPADAAAIMAAGKTITGSLSVMKENARKKAKGGCAIFTPDEGLAIVMEYYGLQGANQTATPKPEPTRKIDIDIDELLGE